MDGVHLIAVIVGSRWGMRIYIPFWVTMPVWLIAFEGRCLYLIYLSRYFERLQLRQQMTWKLVTIMIGLPISGGVGFAIYIIAVMSSGMLGSGTLKTAPMALAIGAGVIAVVFCVWYAGLLIRYALALKASLRASSQGEAGWAQGTVVA